MSTILRIFIKDLRGICRNIFALIIAIGLCIIPSLYAWFNIYSNWDPYANTASIKIAVYSEDTGFDMDGEYQNMGNSIIDNLKENDKLGWTFTKDMESTIDGVKRTDKVLIESAQTLGADDKTVLTKVILPSAVPPIVSGLKVGVGIALMCTISAEMIGSSSGLGYLILTATNLFDTGTTVVGMLVIGLIGLILDYVFGLIEKRVFW